MLNFFPTFAYGLGRTFGVAGLLICVGEAIYGQQLEIKYNLLELPSSKKTHSELQRPVFATLDRQPLGKSLIELSRTYEVSLWLDRRVDRSRVVTFDSKSSKSEGDNSALGTLRAIAKLGGADAGLIENVLYVGPAIDVPFVQRAAVRLHDELSRSSRDAKMQALSWDELTTPTELMNKIASQWQVGIDVEVPHDLMHAGQLPASTLATQLTLLCAGFELQAEPTSDHRIISRPLEQQATWQCNYLKKDLQTNQLANARRNFPGASATIQGTIAKVVGPTDFHLSLFTRLRPAPPDVRELKFAIPEIKAPLEKILGDLARQLGMQLEWDARITRSQKEALLKLSVPEPRTLDEVLKTIAASSGVVIERQEQSIIIQPLNN